MFKLIIKGTEFRKFENEEGVRITIKKCASSWHCKIFNNKKERLKECVFSKTSLNNYKEVLSELEKISNLKR